MLQIAKILKSNGTLGAVLMGFRDFSPEEINTEEPVFIYFDGLPVPFFIEELSPKGNRAVVRLTGVRNLKDAEEIVGQAVWAEESALPEYDNDSDDPSVFVGWAVFDNGSKVGEVSGIEDIPGNLCIYIQTNDGEAMIPLHEDFVESIDEDARTLYLNLPEGLI